MLSKQRLKCFPKQRTTIIIPFVYSGSHDESKQAKGRFQKLQNASSSNAYIRCYVSDPKKSISRREDQVFDS